MIFDGMLRNMDNVSGKFLMYPRNTIVSNNGGTKPSINRQPKKKTTKVPQPSEYTNIAADEAVHKEGVTVCDSLLIGVNTPQSNEDKLQHIELMKIYTKLQKKVLDLKDELKRTKTAQQTTIDGLEGRVKKLKKKHRSRTYKLKRLYKVGLTARRRSEVLGLVKARFEKVQPADNMDSFLLHNLKTMFEHHVEDNNILYYLLVEKMYPLTHHTLHQMFNDVKIHVDYECEMAYELLRLVKK
nr:hypothetical protein [Tanacetum cinerariifolium]